MHHPKPKKTHLSNESGRAIDLLALSPPQSQFQVALNSECRTDSSKHKRLKELETIISDLTGELRYFNSSTIMATKKSNREKKNHAFDIVNSS